MNSFDFDIRAAFEDFSLEVAEQIPLDGITALTGPSGSGKTTLLRILAGLERPERAVLRFAGEDWSGLAAHERGVGFVFQDGRLFDHLDVAGNLAYGADRRGAGQAHIDQVVAALDLAPLLGRRPATLSGGERRRVALGRALAARPRILLLDEPLTGLDRDRKRRLLAAIGRACRQFAIPALLVSHDRSEVQALARRELQITAGRSRGWAAMPPRLRAELVSDGAPAARARIAQVSFPVPSDAAAQEALELVLAPGTFLLSSADPGETSALAVVPVRVSDSEAAGADACRLEFADGQSLELDRAHIPPGIRAGATLYLSLHKEVIPDPVLSR